MKLILVSRDLYGVEGSVITPVLPEYVKSSNSLNFIYPKDKITYKIDQIKEFTSSLNKKPSDSENVPVYLLMMAHTLTPICQNALLKTLEESIYNLILVTRNVDALLPTIKSRCQIVFMEKADQHVEAPKYSLDLASIPALIKLDRNEVKALLEYEISISSPEHFEKVLSLQNALKKVEANCKIESLLYDVILELEK
jgi:DNA polymerase III subunit delta'